MTALFPQETGVKLGSCEPFVIAECPEPSEKPCPEFAQGIRTFLSKDRGLVSQVLKTGFLLTVTAGTTAAERMQEA
jgi:hypothetical protein